MNKPAAVTVIPWLRANLGKSCLAGQTGTDQKALLAAVQIVELYSYNPDPELLHAFALVVKQMQEKQFFLAFHAIAHVMDWSNRLQIWEGASLPIFGFGRCQFEPGARQ